MRNRTAIAGIYLGAGSSSRMGRPKLSIPLGAACKLGGMALEQAARSRLSRIFVVTRHRDKPDWLPDRLLSGDGKCRLVLADDADKGLSYSLRAGAEAAKRSAAEAAIVMLADQPLVDRAMIDRLIGCWESDPGIDYAGYHDGGALLPPVLLARPLLDALGGLTGDKGAKELLGRAGMTGRLLTPDDPAQLADIDTEADLEALLGSSLAAE